MDFEQQIAILEKSPELHSSWYQKQYPDAGMLGMSAAEHYLRFGALLGRNPGSNFDTRFYLDTYPDVATSGINPLLHYILFGEAEGRSKNAAQKNLAGQAKTKDELLRDDIQHRLVKHLWGGHSVPALAGLEAVYADDKVNPKLRFLAAWNAACWYYFVEDYATALALADLIREIDPSYTLTKITTMIYAYSYLALRQTADAQRVLGNYLQSNASDTDMRLAYSNTFADDEVRLQHINQVYVDYGMAPIERIDTRRPLSLENIIARPAPIHGHLKVSVIIPTYNSADKLGIAIDSILAQSWKNLEIIVVDDCSPDETYEVAQAYSKKDPRVIALRQPQNGGAYIARNTGLQHVTGDLITTHDGDDWSHPQKIEKQVQFLQAHPDVMGVCTYWIRAEHSLHFRQDWRLNSHLIHWSHSSFIFHRSILADIGSWDRVVVGGDTEFIWRVQAKYGKSSVRRILPEIPLAFALDDQGSLTRSKATHVKTIHYGLRHIYRSSAQYWHQKKDVALRENSGTRPFPAPLSMLTRNPDTLVVDVLLVADFTDVSMSEALFNAAQKLYKQGKTLALFHWPFFEARTAPLSSWYFEILESCHASPLVHGQDIRCQNTWVADHRLLTYVPEQLPSVSTETGSILVDASFNRDLLLQITEQFLAIYKVRPVLVDINLSEI